MEYLFLCLVEIVALVTKLVVIIAEDNGVEFNYKGPRDAP